jgi:hypothetical protein
MCQLCNVQTPDNGGTWAINIITDGPTYLINDRYVHRNNPCNIWYTFNCGWNYGVLVTYQQMSGMG